MAQLLVSTNTLSLSSLSTEIFPLITLLRPDWTPSNTHLQQFTDGMTNSIFGLFDNSNQSEALVIKIFGSKTEEFIDRNFELQTLYTLFQHDFAQPILLQFANGVIYKFVPGEVCTRDDIRYIKIAPLIAHQMAKLHSISIEDKNKKPCLVPLMRKFLSLIDNDNYRPTGK